MGKAIRVLSLVVGTVCAASAVATADDCLCVKVPMYPIGNGNWFHYAVVCDLPPGGVGDCIDLYPTGYSGQQTLNQQCAGNCGTCLTLGRQSQPVDLHFAERIRDYSELDEPEEFRDFLRRISAPAGDAYSGLEFRSPRVVKLERTKGKSAEAFHAICWKMEPTVAIPALPPVFIGVEINDPRDKAVAIAVSSQYNAMQTRKKSAGMSHSPVPGMLQVQIDSDVAFIRLAKATNRGVEYEPRYSPDPVEPAPAASAPAAAVISNCQSGARLTCTPCPPAQTC